jgi:hypothetical protein
LTLLQRLDKAKIPYQLRHSRPDAIMILAFAPGQYWEIEFLQDGDIDIERFRSNGEIEDESILQELFDLWAEDEAKPETAEEHTDAVA